MHPVSSVQPERIERLERRFVAALDELEAALPISKVLHQNRIYELTLRLLKEPNGPRVLYRHAPRFEAAGVFQGNDWARPHRLRPEFVAHALHQKGLTLAIECLSELRFLAIYNRELEHPLVTAEEAGAFLERVLGFNLDLLFPTASEATRITRETAGELMEGVQRLFEFLLEHIGSHGILASIVSESERILRQRPVMVQRVRTILQTAAETIADGGEGELDTRAAVLINALHGPTELSRSAATLEEYEAALATLDEAALAGEAHGCGDAMWATGLVSPQHAVLLRFLNRERPDLIAEALRLESTGRSSLALNIDLVRDLIEVAVHPETAQCVHGLANLLVSGDLFFPPIAPSLRRLMRLRVTARSAHLLQRVLRQEAPEHDLSPTAILLAGTLSVLGQPLGVGQGDNPTCQSARAISLWAQVDGGYLLALLTEAARDDSVTLHFEGQALASGDLPPGMNDDLHTELDAVSLVLVPHLDRIYAEMSRQVAFRGGDPHRWINPEFHGWWVYRDFALALDVPTATVTRYEDFVRLFYATYHPTYRGEAELIYPQPIGIAATDHRGIYLGWHAISIQRVARGADGSMRVYFYNPNNDGGQNWGHGVVTSTGDHHEVPGESSLPFDEFASRLYLFHYSERDHGDPALVPAEDVAGVTAMAQASWGASFPWAE
jgi:hypothetical protein